MGQDIYIYIYTSENEVLEVLLMYISRFPRPLWVKVCGMGRPEFAWVSPIYAMSHPSLFLWWFMWSACAGHLYTHYLTRSFRPRPASACLSPAARSFVCATLPPVHRAIFDGRNSRYAWVPYYAPAWTKHGHSRPGLFVPPPPLRTPPDLLSPPPITDTRP